MAIPPLLKQTTYAELLERCSSAAFTDEFPDEGNFTSKTVKGRRYWYFQSQTVEGRAQKYVGPENPELLKRIEHHRDARDDERERRALVSTLVRSFGLPRPVAQIGDVIAALAKTGVFRLHGVLVGTMAYQTYPAMLGIKLPGVALQTSDVDVAQFLHVSIAVEDQTAPMLDVLKGVDKTFREVPHTAGNQWATAYIAKGGVRVEFLTPNQGPDMETPKHLPALQTDADPLRFLDFLIREPESAVLLHGAGICVQVPSPERYAVHKLIVARRRRAGTGKREKDLNQSGTLLAVLAEKRPNELRLAWDEAVQRGPKWRSLVLEGMAQLAPRSRDIALKAVGFNRKTLPGMDITFSNLPARYDFDRDLVTFNGEALGSGVTCAISREAIEDHFDADDLNKDGRIEAFVKNRSKIEQMARAKYLSWPVEEPEAVLIKTMDVEKLLKQKEPEKNSPAKKKK